MTNLEKVYELLDESKVFYIVSVDGDKPKARPISFKMIYDNKIWFGVGTFKDVYKQLQANPNVEIVCNTQSKWMRYDGKAKFVEDIDIENKCLDLLGNIGKMYRDNNYRMGMFYIENGHVEIKSVIKTIEEFNL